MNDKEREKAVELVKGGMKPAQVAVIFDVTRQYISQLCKSRKVKVRKVSRAQYKRRLKAMAESVTT